MATVLVQVHFLLERRLVGRPGERPLLLLGLGEVGAGGAEHRGRAADEEYVGWPSAAETGAPLDHRIETPMTVTTAGRT
jgi:hypothetical protein